MLFEDILNYTKYLLTMNRIRSQLATYENIDIFGIIVLRAV